MQHKRYSLPWETQDGVDCWNCNSYVSVWRVGRSNSVNLSKTNSFAISWMKLYQSVHSSWKHDTQTSSVLLWNKNRCQSIGNVSVFLLHEKLTFKRFWMLGRVFVYSMRASTLPAWCPASYRPLWQFLSWSNDSSLCFRETETEWKCCAICFCAMGGLSEKCPYCSLWSTTLSSLMLGENRHLGYSCHEHYVAFMPSLRQLDCWRPDGTLRYIAVNQDFTSPAAQRAQN